MFRLINFKTKEIKEVKTFHGLNKDWFGINCVKDYNQNFAKKYHPSTLKYHNKIMELKQYI